MVDNKVRPVVKPIHVLPTLRKLMSIWQLWPESSRMPIRRLILFLTYTLVIHIPMMLYTYVYRDDFIEFSLGLCEVMALNINVVKHFTFFAYNETIKKVLDDLENMWAEAFENGSRKWIALYHEHQRLTKRNTLIVASIFFSASVVYVILPCLVFLITYFILGWPQDVFTLGAHVEYPHFEYRTNMKNYMISVGPFTMVHIYFALSYACATNFIPSVMNYALTYFRYLATEIERFDEDYQSLEKIEIGKWK